MNDIYLHLKDWLQHAKDGAVYLWGLLLVCVFGCATTITKKFITDNIGSLKVADLRARYACWKERRAALRSALAQQRVVEQPQHAVPTAAPSERNNAERFLLRVICMGLVVLIVARLLSLAGSKDSKSQNEILALFVLLLLAVFISSGMLDKVVEQLKAQQLAKEQNKQLN